MSTLTGLIRYEYRMSIHRWGVWLAFGLVFAFSLWGLIVSPAPALRMAQAEGQPWGFAGQIVLMLNMFAPVVAGIAVADRLSRDRQLNVSELISSAPVSRPAYLAGKYLGSLLSVLTPPLVVIFPLAVYLAITWSDLRLIPAILSAYLGITVPAYAFVTAFSLACPVVIPLRVYQVLFTGYWFWGNYVSPEFMPTLSGTLLSPSGVFVMEGFFGTDWVFGGSYTSMHAILNLTILALCCLAALAGLERYLNWKAA